MIHCNWWLSNVFVISKESLYVEVIKHGSRLVLYALYRISYGQKYSTSDVLAEIVQWPLGHVIANLCACADSIGNRSLIVPMIPYSIEAGLIYHCLGHPFILNKKLIFLLSYSCIYQSLRDWLR